jgi:hypothetical protein
MATTNRWLMRSQVGAKGFEPLASWSQIKRSEVEPATAWVRRFRGLCGLRFGVAMRSPVVDRVLVLSAITGYYHR